MQRFLNSKKQGDAGLGIAIGWFASQGYTVSIPLTDSQDYDLVVDMGGKLKRIQVKTTTQRHYHGYKVHLTINGGNQSRKTVKKFDNTKVDFVFAIAGNGNLYFVPSCHIKAKTEMRLGKSTAKFLVNFDLKMDESHSGNCFTL